MPLKSILSLATFGITIYLTYLYFPIFLEYPAISEILRVKAPTNLNLENKLQLFSYLIGFISFYFASIIIITIVTRGIFKKSNPVLEPDHPVTITLNRVLANSVEQTLVFLPLLLNFILNRATAETIQIAINITFVWVLGRFIFAFGYVVGIILNLPKLRGVGYFLNVIASGYLLLDFSRAFLTRV
jgi:uncharacterized MAPEG superfamily protein